MIIVGIYQWKIPTIGDDDDENDENDENDDDDKVKETDTSSVTN